MKTGKLIYDADCPLCVWYTDKFIKHGLLEENNRVTYFQAINDSTIRFNHEIGQNKIAFIPSDEKDPLYGVDSLLAILSNRWKWIGKVGKMPLNYQLLKLFYWFISYNRKIIIPTNCTSTTVCNPSKNWTSRIVFILLMGFTVNAIVSHYFETHLNTYLINKLTISDWYFFGFQFVFQGLFLFMLKGQKYIYDYFGQIAFISFCGSLLLGTFDISLQVLHSLGFHTELLVGVCFGIVLLFMMYEHSKRIHTLGFPTWLTYSWVLYRLLIFPIAFEF